MNRTKIWLFVLFFCFSLVTLRASAVLAQVSEEPDAAGDEEEQVIPPLPPPPGEAQQETPAAPVAREPAQPLPPGADKIEGGEEGAGESRFGITITAAVMMTYVYNDIPDSYTVKYIIKADGQANAATAVIKGDADISAETVGPLAKWPTGECALQISVPKIPFELTFKKNSDTKGSVKLVFKRPITEDWESRCTFLDAPDARFDTRGAPEMWLTKAIEKARPPLKDIVVDLGDEEMTTRFVINKEIIQDPPMGSGEIEGTGVVTVKPGS